MCIVVLATAAFRRRDCIDFQHPQTYSSCGQESSVSGKFRIRWLFSRLLPVVQDSISARCPN